MQNEVELSNRSNHTLFLLLLGGGLIIYPIASFTFFKSYYLFTVMVFSLTIIINESHRILSISKFVTRGKLVLLLCFTFFLSAFFGVNIGNSLNELFWSSIHLVTFYLMAIMVVSFSPRKILILFKACIIVTAVLNFMLLAMYGMVRATPDTKSILGAYSSHMPMYMITCLVYLLFCVKEKIGGKSGNYILIIITVFNIVLSVSRAAFLILIIIIILSPLFLSKRIGQQIVNYIKFSFIGVIFIVLLLIIPYTRNYIQVVAARFDPVIDQIELLWLPQEQISQKEPIRILMYNYGFNLVKEKFWTGVGYGNFKDSMAEVYRGGKKPHNIFLETIGYAGIFGLSILILILITSLYKLRSLYRTFDRQENPFIANWFRINSFALLILTLYAQFKPTLENPIFYFPIAVALFSQEKIVKK